MKKLLIEILAVTAIVYVGKKFHNCGKIEDKIRESTDVDQPEEKGSWAGI